MAVSPAQTVVVMKHQFKSGDTVKLNRESFIYGENNRLQHVFTHFSLYKIPIRRKSFQLAAYHHTSAVDIISGQPALV